VQPVSCPRDWCISAQLEPCHAGRMNHRVPSVLFFLPAVRNWLWALVSSFLDIRSTLVVPVDSSISSRLLEDTQVQRIWSLPYSSSRIIPPLPSAPHHFNDHSNLGLPSQLHRIHQWKNSGRTYYLSRLPVACGRTDYKFFISPL